MKYKTIGFIEAGVLALTTTLLVGCGALNPFSFKSKNLKFNAQSDDPAEQVCKGQVRSLFLSTVNPILEKKCASCHSTQSFSLRVGGGLDNYGFAASRGDQVLAKGTGDGGHPGGAPLGTEDAAPVADWLDAEAACKRAIAAANGNVNGTVAGCTADIKRPRATAATTANSNLSRSSGEVMQLRLARLFPNAPGGKLDAKNFSLYAAEGLNRMLGRPERFTTVVSQIALQSLIEPVCIDAAKNARGDAGAIFSDGFLMSGETWPADAVTALALKAARNGWLYPYLATDPEVIELKTLYANALRDATDVGRLSAANAETAARSSLCLAIVSAPQFWLGNSGELDVLRRVALEIGREAPTPQAYSDFRSASDKPAYLRSYTANLQTRSSYRDAVEYWHEDWLGLRPFSQGYDNNAFDSRDYVVAMNGTSQISGMQSSLGRFDASASGTELEGQYEVRLFERDYDGFKGSSEICEKKAQAFDPRTVEIRWEHRNPASGQWETIGRWLRNGDGTYRAEGGEVTLTGGAKKPTTLEDVRFAQGIGNQNFRYTEGALVGTPLETFSRFDRRVRRFSPSGEQNGFSAVRLYQSGQTAYTCNTLARYTATCAYRANVDVQMPSGAFNIDNRNWKADSTGPRAWSGAGTDWVSSPGRQATRMYPVYDRGGQRLVMDSFAFPQILDHFRCGTPDLNVMAKAEGNAAGFDEDAAFPKGFSDYSNTGAPGGLYATDYTHHFSQYWGDASSAEAQAINLVRSDLRLETSRLLNSALTTGNYRELLTANYTFGTDFLKLLYSTQGVMIPAYPNGFSMSSSPSAVKRIEASSLAPLQAGWAVGPFVTGRGRSSALPDPFRNFAKNTAGYTIPAKSMAGILTTPSFLAPTGGTMRTVASRIFTRLLCSEPTQVRLGTSELDLHKKYVTQSTHIKEGCIGCHAHLDPLASAMSAAFAKDPMIKRGPFTASETTTYSNSDGGAWGLRGVNNPSEGAFLGKKVTGVREVAQAIVDSPEFARCTVQKAFENIFGRTVPTAGDCAITPTHPDCLLVKTVSTSFRSSSGTNFNYDKMIQELVSSSLNLRKN